VVLQGDLTACTVDAIVNPANSNLWHGGGVAGAIARKGGRIIDDESEAWIRQHKHLAVGHAMHTRSGNLPCRVVIHTVGPQLGGWGSVPTLEDAQQLRSAVNSALREAEQLQLESIALPGISSGIFGYPRDLAASEITGECTRYAREYASSTTLKTILLMNIDAPTHHCFQIALQELMGHTTRSEMLQERADNRRLHTLPALDLLALVQEWGVNVLVQETAPSKVEVLHGIGCARVFGCIGTMVLRLLRNYRTQDISIMLQYLTLQDTQWRRQRQSADQREVDSKPRARHPLLATQDRIHAY
jgi:O-acetyl-ADP-ribose deacetylase (regulator of RNase III)